MGFGIRRRALQPAIRPSGLGNRSMSALPPRASLRSFHRRGYSPQEHSDLAGGCGTFAARLSPHNYASQKRVLVHDPKAGLGVNGWRQRSNVPCRRLVSANCDPAHRLN
jgi:hypothetical protein